MNKFITNITGPLTKKKVIWSIVLLAVVAIGIYIATSKTGETTQTTAVVRRGEFIKEVSVSGKVTASETVDLTFADTGRVANIAVVVGDKVKKGQRLANLSTEALLADLASAEAKLAQIRAQNQNTATNVEKVRKEQDTLVASAYSSLLSNDLVSVPVSNRDTTITPPTITGRYSGTTEGVLKFSIRRDFTAAETWVVRTFGLERSPEIDILDDEPTPLGTQGLYVTFPDTLSNYSNTDWTVSIPNTKSSTYLTKYNEYQEALRTRDREIAQAEAELVAGAQGASVSQTEIASAQAEVARVRAEINERTIYAPFDGVVTAVDAKLGGIASANEKAISLMSSSQLQVESYVPEIHVPFVKVGAVGTITLDAYGEDKTFTVWVLSLDPAETIRDGVPTYRAKIEFDAPDERIRSGMTANVVITSERKPDVLMIPQGAVTTKDNAKVVTVLEGEITREQIVTVGGISSYGEIEILSGLSEGDVVLVPTSN
jgi:HlyD family secretion protein